MIRVHFSDVSQNEHLWSHHPDQESGVHAQGPQLSRAPFSYYPCWVTLSLSSATCKVLPIFVLHVNSIMQQVCIHVWLLVFNIMFVKIVTHFPGNS